MSRHFLITGGAGFIGSNYASHLLMKGEKVSIFDNLSRSGSRLNLEWLNRKFGQNSFSLVNGDIRDADLMDKTAAEADVIVHLAGQVAVTSSVIDPRFDFDTNALGTLNILEAARKSKRNPVVLYASTNKVYGEMDQLVVMEDDKRYYYRDYPQGVDEKQPLDFHSPYGCSKGCGDQYVRDYQRIYGLRTVVLRQSCIFGPRQFGVEDQGWVAWFIIACQTGTTIKIYGNGKQVRDLLYIDDLMRAYDLAIENSSISAGNIYNVGGGARNALSVWKEFGSILSSIHGREINVEWGDWRPGDQKIFVSDTHKAGKELNWQPQIGAEEGIRLLYDWVKDNLRLFKNFQQSTGS